MTTKQPWLLLSALSISLALLSLGTVYGQEEGGVYDTNQTDVSSDEGERVVEYPDNDDDTPDQSSAQRAEALQRRAGEQVGGEAGGRAVVLGMYVQEADNQRMKVIEVAAASPAFDAGIREGDEIISFDGFKADSYREWVDGIRKLMNDAPEGDTMPIQLLRGGRIINLRLRKQVARADEARNPDQRILSQPILQEGQPPTQPIQLPQPNQPVGGGGDVMVADFFGGQFGEQLAGTTDRAVAEIFRLNMTQQPAQSTAGRLARRQGRTVPDQGNQAAAVDVNAQAQGAAAPTGLGSGPRIGLAGFRDDQTGMLVMLDVGGLEAGNYLVGIDDPGTIAARANVGGTPPNTTQQAAPSAFDPTVRPDPTSTRRVEPHNATPRTNRTNRGAQPQSGQQGQRQLVPRTVLAQVIDAAQGGASAGNATGGAAAGAVQTPSTGQAQPLDTPNTGQARPLDTPARDPNADGFQATDQTQDGLDASAGSPGTGLGAGPAIPVGTLTVDQSGTGRLQQVVEGMQVRAVVGQAIVIYIQAVPPANALPANLDVGTGPARQPATGTRRVGGALGGPAQGRGVPNPAVPQGTSATVGNQMQPVAAGIIQMFSDIPPTGAAEAGQQPGAVETGQQPAASLPTSREDLR
ncbi:MAG: PDZ domain-containing protein [Pirellulales bacterium]